MKKIVIALTVAISTCLAGCSASNEEKLANMRKVAMAYSSVHENFQPIDLTCLFGAHPDFNGKYQADSVCLSTIEDFVRASNVLNQALQGLGETSNQEATRELRVIVDAVESTNYLLVCETGTAVEEYKETGNSRCRDALSQLMKVTSQVNIYNTRWSMYMMNLVAADS